MTTSVETLALELAVMRSISRNLEANLAKLDEEAQGRVLAWALAIIKDKSKSYAMTEQREP